MHRKKRNDENAKAHQKIDFGLKKQEKATDLNNEQKKKKNKTKTKTKTKLNQ